MAKQDDLENPVNCDRGAPTGRREKIGSFCRDPKTGAPYPFQTTGPYRPRFRLRRLRIDSQGYDAGGAYWGHGEPVYGAQAYRYANGDLVPLGMDIATYTRASSREDAKAQIRQRFPGAVFYR